MRRFRLSLACLSAACAAADAPANVTRTDSAGIEIVTHTAWPDARWSVEGPVLDIGTAEGEGATSLFRVVGAARLSDGRIVIANAGSSELRWFDDSGAPMMSAGRRGEGPGEFTRMQRLVRGRGDSVVVYDAGTARVSVFAPDGAFARDVILNTSGRPAELVGLLGDGTMVAQSSLLETLENLASGRQRPPKAVYTTAANGAPADTIGVFPGDEAYVHFGETSGGGRSVEISRTPFHRATALRAGASGLWVALQDAPEVDLYVSSALARRVRLPIGGLAITDAMVDAWVARSTGDMPPEQAAEVAAGLRSMPLPEQRPPFGLSFSDEVGNLWLADFDDMVPPQESWSVIAPDGDVLARVTLPEGFAPYAAGDDWILGRERDDLDVEHVTMYRLVKGSN